MIGCAVRGCPRRHRGFLLALAWWCDWHTAAREECANRRALECQPIARRHRKQVAA